MIILERLGAGVDSAVKVLDVVVLVIFECSNFRVSDFETFRGKYHARIFIFL